MNFYKHHLGDYDGHTAHLTWDEDMAYTRLLRAYYRREKPILPEEAHRLARATSKAQKAAVDSVLAEFFFQAEDGWHNKRADEEVAAYQAQASTNRRIAQARTVQRTVNESSTKGTPNQEPEPEPLTKKSNALSGKPDVTKDSAKQLLDFLNQKAGRAYRPTDTNLGFIVARLKEGASEGDCRMVIAKKCREWAGDEKMELYLRPATLFNRTKFDQYVGELVEPSNG